MASPTARPSGTPLTARLATAISHRIRVRKVDAPNTTAYCRMKPALVKSTWVVASTTLANSPMTQEAAFAQLSAIDCSGSSGGACGTRLDGSAFGTHGPPGMIWVQLDWVGDGAGDDPEATAARAPAT